MAVAAEMEKSARLLEVEQMEAFSLFSALMGANLADPSACKPLEPEKDSNSLLRPAISCPMIGLAQLSNLWQVLHEESVQDFSVLRDVLGAGLAGHSQGVVAAVAFASSQNLADFRKSIVVAVTLLWLIGHHVEAIEGSMALVRGEGLMRADLEALLDAEPIPSLFVAGRNLVDTFVLAGTPAAVKASGERLAASALAGCSFRELHVRSPFHTALLEEVVPRVLADAAKLGLSFGELQVPVFGGGGRLTTSSIQNLVELICTAPLDWPTDMAEAAGSYDFLVEFGPGGPLPLADKPVLRLTVPSKTLAVKAAIDPRSCIEEKLVEALGGAAVDLDTPFFELGLTSRDLSRLAASVTEELGAQVDAIDLLDFPTARSLGDCMEQRLALSKKPEVVTKAEMKTPHSGSIRPGLWGSVYGSVQQEAGKTQQGSASWDSLSIAEVLALQDAIIEATARPEHQGRLAQLAWQCYPDKVRYMLQLDKLQAEVLGPVLLSRRLAKSLSPLEVRRSRAKMQETMMKLTESVPEISEKSVMLARLTLREPWPSSP